MQGAGCQVVTGRLWYRVFIDLLSFLTHRYAEDRPAVHQPDQRWRNMELVNSILAMARANRRPVIAEGIESYDIARKLMELGCDYGQGFGIAKPMSLADYIEFAGHWRPEDFLNQANRLAS